jgi:hypothetical protein
MTDKSFAADARLRRASAGLLLWALFFLICLGLGYATLGRYKPGTAVGLSDAEYYHQLVTSSPAEVGGRYRYRVLVPYTAKPFYRLARGRVGSWDPVLSALLVANSIYSATSALLLYALGRRFTGEHMTALLAAALFLLNFNVVNFHLSGMVDAAEGCLMLAVVAALAARREWLLPLLGVLGGLAKETFVPLSAVLAGAWWLADGGFRKRRFGAALWCVGLAAAGLAAVTVLKTAVAGQAVWPWQTALEENSNTNPVAALLAAVFSRDFWYVFVWLVPLGVWRLRKLPRAWVLAAVGAAAAALLLGAYNNAGGNVARPVFDVAGPLLSLSAALFLSDLKD